jgi:ERCC4-type nuclease
MIIIDSRESRCAIPALLAERGVKTEMREMERGDYLIANRFLVERKDANDFAVSIMDGRLFAQAEMLPTDGYEPVILLEGDLTSIRSAIDAEAIAGALAALVTFFPIRIVPSGSAAHSAAVISRIYKHATEGLGYEIPLRSSKPPPPAIAQFLIEGLPGIGAETARKLLLHFGSARKIFLATESELKAVKGIGPKTIALIQEALDMEPTGFPIRKTR